MEISRAAGSVLSGNQQYAVGSFLGITPSSPPTYDENAAKNPDGPFQFMPIVDFSRTSLGMEVNWDPPLAKDSTAILYPEALSVQKLRGNVLKQFDERYPHCIDMEWDTVKTADGKADLRDIVTLRLGKLDGPEKRGEDPRNFYFCRLENKVPEATPNDTGEQSGPGDPVNHPTLPNP